MSNTWNEAMMEMIVTKNVVGESSGRVIFQNWRHFDAPSIWAASRYVAGMPWSPARKITILKPSPAQIETSATAGMTQVVSTSQLGGSSANCSRKKTLIRPKSPLSIQSQTIETATELVIVGRKKIVR